MKRYLNVSLKIIVSVCLLLYVYSGNIDLYKTIEALFKADIFLVTLSFLLVILNYVFSSVRWKFLILSEKKVSLTYLIKLYFIGSFFNNFLPTSIGGDTYKIVKLGDKINSRTDAFTATFLERFLGMLSLIIVAVVALSFYEQADPFKYIFGVFLIVFAFFIFLLLYPKFKFEHKYFNKIFSILDKIHSSFLRYKTQKNTILISFLSSFLVQFFAVLSQYLLFLALFLSIPIAKAFFDFPAIFLSGYAIPSINGLGSQDSLYVAFFDNDSVIVNSSIVDSKKGELVAAASILYHGVRFVVSLIGGLIYLIDKKHE